MNYTYSFKTILPLLMMTIVLVFIRCSTQVKDFIPGTYTTEWTTEFTEARDTVLIEPSDKAGSGTYQITRRTYMLYQTKPQYKLAHWTGIFNSSNKTIIINNNGRVLSFDPSNKEMKMGSTTYKKL
jgi:hypothetical protein